MEEASQPKPRLRIARHVMAAEHIGRRIVSGELRPGTTLPSSTELARQLSIARPALREALKLLAGKGLVEFDAAPRYGRTFSRCLELSRRRRAQLAIGRFTERRLRARPL